MTRLRTATKVLVLAVPLAAGLYDLVAYLTVGNDATISRVVLAWNDSCAMLGFVAAYAAGLLTAHFWCPQHPDPATDKVPGWRAKGGA